MILLSLLSSPLIWYDRPIDGGTQNLQSISQRLSTLLLIGSFALPSSAKCALQRRTLCLPVRRPVFACVQ
eukprot:164373-Pelagomonas_calceolata.AAC.1